MFSFASYYRLSSRLPDRGHCLKRGWWLVKHVMGWTGAGSRLLRFADVGVGLLDVEGVVLGPAWVVCGCARACPYIMIGWGYCGY